MNRPAEINERGLRELSHLLAEQLYERALKQLICAYIIDVNFDDMSIEISEYLSKTGEPIF
jgi:hypothetical protein